MSHPAFGVISPHPPIMVEAVGGSRSKATSASIEALRRAGRALAAFSPETIVLMSPHAPSVADAFLVDDSPQFDGSLADFGDRTHRSFNGDPELAQLIAEELARAGQPVGMRTTSSRLRPGWLDHASLVPLAFLDPEARYRLVVLSLSYLPYALHHEVGEAVARATETLGRRVAFIASGDLSHRLTPDAPAGYSARGRELDANVVGLVEQGRLAGLAEIDPGLVEAGGECGMRSIIALGGYCCDDPAPVRVLAYEGPWGVGYLTALVGRAAIEADDSAEHEILSGNKGGAPGEVESPIVELARHSIEHRLGTGRPLNDAALPTGMYPAKAGAFVSLHIGGELRGCIGTISPTKDSLAAEVAGNAIEAALHDPRFPPLEVAELAHLDISVDVLGAAEPCSEKDLDPSTYGVIVTSGWRRGLLLPDLEGVDDVGTQVGIALRKAGIAPGEPYSVERFRVDRYT